MENAAAEITPREKIAAAMAALGLTVAAEFVPFSKSRNAANDPGNKPGSRSLNWRVTLQRNGRDVLTTDYSAGIAHAPCYKRLQGKGFGIRWTLENTEAIVFETEHGRAFTFRRFTPAGKPILPDPVDVVWSLSRDSDVLDSGGFEDWAGELGYDPDSRSAESTYRACLEIALKLRGAIGEAGIEALRVAGEDF